MKADFDLMNLSIQYDQEGSAFQLGFQILREQGPGLIPLCPLNGHFTRETIRELVQISCEVFSRTYFFIPDSPTVHTLLARGKSLDEAKKKAKQQSKQLLRRTEAALSEFGTRGGRAQLLDWDRDIARQPVYRDELKRVVRLFEQSEDFRTTVEQETDLVLQSGVGKSPSEEQIRLGVPYVWEELAFLASVHRILDVERIGYVYHKAWFLTDVIDGRFDGQHLNHLGFVLVNRAAAKQIQQAGLPNLAPPSPGQGAVFHCA
jgi:tRNA-dependent cyclodipeptide synthase